MIKTSANLARAIRELNIEGKIATDEILRQHTTLSIGGPAEVFIEPFSLESLRRILIFAEENSIALFILGGGSKVLIPDEGLSGITLKLDAPLFKKIGLSDGYVKLGSGVKISEFLSWMIKNSFGGGEFLAGLPATMGGAVMLNAGVRERPNSARYIQIWDFVEGLMVMNKKGEILTLPREAITFSYRHSNLSDYVILEIRLSGLIKKDKTAIQERISRYFDYRRAAQELESSSAGCVFKNPGKNRQSSGELIEISGMKGKRIGDIMVSHKHANFMLNVGEGKAKDFIELMHLVQDKVKLDHNIWLEPEIKIIKN